MKKKTRIILLFSLFIGIAISISATPVHSQAKAGYTTHYYKGNKRIKYVQFKGKKYTKANKTMLAYAKSCSKKDKEARSYINAATTADDKKLMGYATTPLVMYNKGKLASVGVYSYWYAGGVGNSIIKGFTMKNGKMLTNVKSVFKSKSAMKKANESVKIKSWKTLGESSNENAYKYAYISGNGRSFYFNKQKKLVITYNTYELQLGNGSAEIQLPTSSEKYLKNFYK